YVPLDPDYPKERLAFMLEDTQARILLTQERLLARLPEQNPEIVCVDRDWEQILQNSDENPERGATADNLAYVMYTSGSTGKPKGVEVLHRGVVRLLFGVGYVRLDENKTFLHLAPTSFDASTFEIWGALLHGAKCVLYRERVPSANELGQLLHQHKVSTLWLTSSLFNSVVDENAETLSEVKQLLIGGEALSIPHVRRALDLLPETEIINGYGPTENTTFTSCYSIPRELDETVISVSIGRPIGNTEVYLLDRHLNAVPIGVPGELYIGGDGLARGYLNSPELTAEKFVPNPFTKQPGTRLYRTGDLCRYLPDGDIEFLGRIDDQVKIRGYRIELGEIEAVLGQYPEVRETVVVTREDNPADKRLVAYVVPNQEHSPSSRELRAFLKEKLPDYMIPFAFVALVSLPLTPNGKVDRKALPPPGQTGLELNYLYTAPRTGTERLLAKIWEEVLTLEPVGIHDNFFDVGGHSLLGVRLISRVCEEFQLDLPLRCLFEFSTIARLAKRIESETFKIVSDRIAKSPWSYLFELKPGNGKTPVFFLPGGVGGYHEFLVYARLAHCVGSDYHFYGFCARSAGGTKQAHFRVEEMAADYLKEIQALYPKGPYFFVGECIGGIVAYEMARQLEVQGQRVALLALIDTDRPTVAKYFRYRTVRMLQPIMDNYYAERLAFHWKRIRQLDWFGKLPYLFQTAGALLRVVSHDLPQMLIDGRKPELEAMMRHARRVEEGYIEALRRYRPKPYKGRVSMIVNEESFRRNPTFGWADLVTGEIQPYKARGDHESYIRDHVHAVARQLKQCLEKAEEEL
ncbi:MAG TPA: amino acid adenylation domain-containing protein, partial [Candidatus Binatia bacterium]